MANWTLIGSGVQSTNTNPHTISVGTIPTGRIVFVGVVLNTTITSITCAGNSPVGSTHLVTAASANGYNAYLFAFDTTGGSGNNIVVTAGANYNRLWVTAVDGFDPGAWTLVDTDSHVPAPSGTTGTIGWNTTAGQAALAIGKSDSNGSVTTSWSGATKIVDWDPITSTSAGGTAALNSSLTGGSPENIALTISGHTGPDIIVVGVLYEAASASDDLTLTGIATGAPSVGTATLGQTHVLAPAAVATGSPGVGAATLGQTHVLAATGIATGAPTVDAVTVTEAHALSVDPITTGAPTVGAATLGQTHVLSATGVATGAPTVGAAALGQTHALSATGIATGAPTIGALSVSSGGAHNLALDPVATGAPDVGAATLGQTHVLPAAGIATGAPDVGAVALGQTHVLSATGIATDAPGVGTVALGQTHVLSAVGIDAGSPTIGTAAFGQTHVLGAVAVAAGIPSLGAPILVQVHDLVLDGIATGAPTLGNLVVAGKPVFIPQFESAGRPAFFDAVGRPAFFSVIGKP